MRYLLPFLFLCTAISSAAPEENDAELFDSLEYVLRNDYLVCTGDTTTQTKKQLLDWKAEIDSAVNSSNYRELFEEYQKFTNLKAEDIRPCEPISWSRQLERQLKEMDSLVSAQRKAREKKHKDSLAVTQELASLETSGADLFGIPAGISPESFRWLFSRRSDAVLKKTNGYLRADSIILDSVTLNAAFRFSKKGKYIGYELETAALKADSLDSTVRSWAHRLTQQFTQKLGRKPEFENKVGFNDIKQGRLSVLKQWSKPSTASVLIGLATFRHRYYAKVMVKY
ncbi:MAG: hypothetical protein ACLFQB_04710 [Chitinispirillaceae bacterium]